MTRTTNARLAGFTFLFYIATALPAMILYEKATKGDGTMARLTSITAHPTLMRASFLLALLGCFSAIVLAVTLYGITRDVDHDLAMLVLTFRTGEGVLGAISIMGTIGLLWVARTAGTAASDPATTSAVATLLFKMNYGALGATFFAAGSTVFSYLLLRGRIVPVPLAWLGLIVSALLVVALPLEMVGFLSSTVVSYLWLPALAFEVPLGFWLLIKGVPAAGPREAR